MYDEDGNEIIDPDSSMDRDVLINTKYENAMATAFQFLSVFLKKCGSKSEETDFRPLFENFLQDLLVTVNTPEWPAAELLLSLLGKILVSQFANRGQYFFVFYQCYLFIQQMPSIRQTTSVFFIAHLLRVQLI